MSIWLPRDASEKAGLLAWALARLPIDDFGPAYPIGICRDNRIAAVAVFNRWYGPSIELSAAAETPRWATRQAISFILSWPFVTHPAIRRLTAMIKSRNARSRRLAEWVGLTLEGVMVDAFEDDDAAVYRMTRREFQESRWHVEPPLQKAA